MNGFGQGVNLFIGPKHDNGQLGNCGRGLRKRDNAFSVQDCSEINDQTGFFAVGLREDSRDESLGIGGMKNSIGFKSCFDDIEQRLTARDQIHHRFRKWSRGYAAQEKMQEQRRLGVATL